MANEQNGAETVGNYNIRIGRPNNWKRFAEENHELLTRLPKLFALANSIFNRQWSTASPTDRLIMFFGCLCFEDFDEIVVLGGNGMGFGALKILRGLFERVTTISHLHRHPEDTGLFFDFHHVSQYKRLNAHLEATGPYGDIDKEAVASLKAESDRVKHLFTRSCPTKDCEQTIPRFNWHNNDIVSMAKQDPHLKALVGIAYYEPMVYTHPTVQSLLSHLSDDDGGISLRQSDEQAFGWAAKAVLAAHNLTLKNFDIQLEHFPELQAELKSRLEDCVTDFHACWDRGLQGEVIADGAN